MDCYGQVASACESPPSAAYALFSSLGMLSTKGEHPCKVIQGQRGFGCTCGKELGCWPTRIYSMREAKKREIDAVDPTQGQKLADFWLRLSKEHDAQRERKEPLCPNDDRWGSMICIVSDENGKGYRMD